MSAFARNIAITLVAVAGLTPVRAALAAPSDDEIKAILQDRIDRARQSVGIVVGWVDERGARVVGHGKPSRESQAAVDGQTVFEIGSVTKAFTGALLAEMVERGEVRLDDPIAKYLPAGVKAPTRGDRPITLLDLATHTSGLPRMPGNFAPQDPSNPFADYTVERMYAFLSGYSLPRDIGASYEYSNYGMGLLGHILALRAGTDYESLLRDRICRPLGMNSTAIQLSPGMRERLASGHDGACQPVANWDIPTLAGAGGLRSTVDDMNKFVAANLGLPRTPLYRALRFARRARRPITTEMEIGLGWHVREHLGAKVVWHNGQTGGYHSFVGLDVQGRRGVVVLSNSSNSIDDIGRHLLDSTDPLDKLEPPAQR